MCVDAIEQNLVSGFIPLKERASTSYNFYLKSTYMISAVCLAHNKRPRSTA
jgi:hypothetical protein